MAKTIFDRVREEEGEESLSIEEITVYLKKFQNYLDRLTMELEKIKKGKIEPELAKNEVKLADKEFIRVKGGYIKGKGYIKGGYVKSGYVKEILVKEGGKYTTRQYIDWERVRKENKVVDGYLWGNKVE